MPYIPQENRQKLDRSIADLVDWVVEKLLMTETKTAEISSIYTETLVKLGDAIINLITKKPAEGEPQVVGLAQQIIENSNSPTAWLGNLTYSLTMLIQLVPAKLVQKGIWKEEFRYWIYVQTIGGILSAISKIEKLRGTPAPDWIIDGLIGVFMDTKDEYKRRVNVAYETIQIKKSGDCYITPYHTEPVEYQDGWIEVSKDYRKNKK